MKEQEPTMEPIRITVDELKKRMDRRETVAFVDSRNSKAWEETDATVPGCIRIPADAVAQNFQKLPKDRLIVTYCT